jgi:sugar phosphate isomerase/epimerase
MGERDIPVARQSGATRRRISLAHLTIVDADPLELIDAAEAGGFDMLGLRIVAPMATDRIVPVVGDEALIRRIEVRLRDTGLRILDVEAVWLTPDTAVGSLIPVLETGQRLGASHLLTVGNDPDNARVADNFARLCEAARPFGIKPTLELIPYCQTGTLDAALQLVAKAAHTNAGILIDALHLIRSGGRPELLRSIDPTLLDYCQICQAGGQRPPNTGLLRAEARGNRLYPNSPEGRLPLADILAALPSHLVIGVEAPCATYSHLSPVERGRLCGDSTRAFLNTLSPSL